MSLARSSSACARRCNLKASRSRLQASWWGRQVSSEIPPRFLAAAKPSLVRSDQAVRWMQNMEDQALAEQKSRHVPEMRQGSARIAAQRPSFRVRIQRILRPSGVMYSCAIFRNDPYLRVCRMLIARRCLTKPVSSLGTCWSRSDERIRRSARMNEVMAMNTLPAI